MTTPPLPPLFGFTPLTPDRVESIRSQRFAMWRAQEEAVAAKPKRSRKPPQPSTIEPSPKRRPRTTTTLPAGLSPEMRELLLAAYAKQGLV